MDLLAAIIPDFTTGVFLFIAIGLALSFEFVNGFHDTANAVATVIYTNTLRPVVAVIWSGLWNLIGVLTSTGAVAYGIVALLPVDLVLNVGSGAGFAMVFALLVSAIIWNVGTWYFGLPASSSHTLIGSILGVGLANSLMAGHPFGTGVNWAKAQEVGMSLVLSPLIGFAVSALLLLLLKALVKSPKLFTAPEKDKAPPVWIRGLLMLTCTGVSFAHGSNDGQKGMGLMVLILVGILPGTFALKMDENQQDLQAIMGKVHDAQMVLVKYATGEPVPLQEASAKTVSAYLKASGKPDKATYSALAASCGEIEATLLPLKSFSDLTETDRRALRTEMYVTSSALAKLVKSKAITDPAQTSTLTAGQKQLDSVTKYIPSWVKFAVALALGLGTMIGWKRIVVTVGEKIGKSHLTYAQGASAELVAMTTIELADQLGLPVSTTHVLSSGIAGTMAANRSGLQAATLRNIVLAWVLTLPVCIFLGSLLFAFGNFLVLHHFMGLK